MATNPKVLVETSGSDGEHDQEKLHRFLEARIPPVSSSDPEMRRTDVLDDSCMPGVWVMATYQSSFLEVIYSI